MAPFWLEADRRLVDEALRRLLPRRGAVPPTVRRAMAYSLFPGGKRLRPILALQACRIVGGKVADVLPAAAGIEMIHTYSLVHDDLPALDNDDLRRGRAASHRMFGEAMAILAGDALLTHAFEVMATATRPARDPERRLRAMAAVARAAGVSGMIAGQVRDLEAEGRPFSHQALLRIHRGKTGALIRAALETGAILGGGAPDEVRALGRYGEGIGLAFQIVDDVLDLEGSAEGLGKTAGTDRRDRKATFPALLGVAASRRRAQESARHAVRALSRFGTRAQRLRDLARYIVERAH
jgi:geranylgeranyl diphosphate synthase type II